jgi:hypothetical protein
LTRSSRESNLLLQMDELMRRVLSLLNARHLGPFEAEIHDGSLKAIGGTVSSASAATNDARLSPLRWLLCALQHRYYHAIVRAVPVWLTGCPPPSESAAALLESIDSNLATPQLSALFGVLLKAEQSRWTALSLYQAARKVSQGTAVPTASTVASPAAPSTAAATATATPAAAAVSSSSSASAAAPTAASTIPAPAAISAVLPPVALTPGSDKRVLRALLVGAVGGSSACAVADSAELRQAFGAQLMHLAAAAGDFDVVRGLVDSGVDVNAPDEFGVPLLTKLTGMLCFYF